MLMRPPLGLGFAICRQHNPVTPLSICPAVLNTVLLLTCISQLGEAPRDVAWGQSHLRPGQRLQVQMIGFALGALVGDLDHNGALVGIRLAASRLVAQLHVPNGSDHRDAESQDLERI